MKKLLFIVLELVSFNIYAADPTYDVTKGALQNDSSLCQYGYNPNCGSSGHRQQRRSTEIINIKVPSKYLALAVNIKTGLLVVHLIWILLRQPKNKLLKPANKEVGMPHAKLQYGLETAVLLSHRVGIKANGKLSMG